MRVYVLLSTVLSPPCHVLGVYSSLDTARAAARGIEERRRSSLLEEWGRGIVGARRFWSAGDYEIEWFTVDAPPYEP